MTLSELRYLIAVADLRHFGHAAERCHITQSTLSTQLRKLEDYLGATLFERTNRSVTVTAIGKEIVIRARRIVEEVDQICEVARQNEGLLSSTLRLGIIPTLSPYLLPLFLGNLHQAYPQIRLMLHEDLTSNLLSALTAHEVDVLALALPPEVHGLRSFPLFNETFSVAFPAGDSLGKLSAIVEDDLAGCKLLLLAEGHCLRDQALAVCGENLRKGLSSPDLLRATSLETICSMVAAGLGYTLLPELSLPRLTVPGSGVETRPYKVPGAHRTISLVWRNAFPRNDDLVAFGKFIQAHLPEGIQRVGKEPSAPTRRAAA